MITPQTRQFNARLEPFSAVREFIDHFCAGAGAPDHTREDLVLIVDELSENTVRHGYATKEGNDADYSIWLTLSVSGRDIVALYEDAARAFNPFSNIVEPDYSGPAENWRIGGWGVPIIARITGDLRYEYCGGRNRIHFSLPINPQGE